MQLNGSKINVLSEFSALDLEKPGIYSFINLASIGVLLDVRGGDYRRIKFLCDGFLICWLLSLLTFRKVKRYSFDFTSLAGCVFSWAAENDKSIFVLGSEESELDRFCDKLRAEYSGLTIIGRSNGYVAHKSWRKLSESIVDSGADLLLVGLGAGLQEDFLSQVSEAGYSGLAFSCGGFIRQTSSSSALQYYPPWVDALALRSFYRMYKEPHTIRRYLLDYPKNLFRVVFTRLISVD